MDDLISLWGKCLGYSPERCPNCGRVRLENYENGKQICEKCQWSPQEQRYIEDEELYPPEEDYHAR